ncbi:uncharacterized protein LOC123970310 [Xyrichtys novacula]|uniref:Uncharacterized protein LOC123970310 n=1 Tax=Xyrichtys novacula TaxID=13765 RepID=A0AAV1HNM3_XYRNO|nr:uncharacterized protein LOC123970310 [Xyrichtys novacula]
MAKWTICLVMFLLMVKGSDVEEMIEKAIWTDSDITPLCTDDTVDYIIMIICKIRIERHGEGCRLSYSPHHGFEHTCDSGYTLLSENQTVSLHLTNLTPEDSGNYSCECSHTNGTYFSHLSLTVKVGNDVKSSTLVLLPTLLVVTTLIIVAGIILGFLYRRMCHRKQAEPPENSPPNMDSDDTEPYSTLNQRAITLYSTLEMNVCNKNTN